MGRHHLLFCQQYPTTTCVTGNGEVRSCWDNVASAVGAHQTLSSSSGDYPQVRSPAVALRAAASLARAGVFATRNAAEANRWRGSLLQHREISQSYELEQVMTVSTKTRVMLWGRSAHRCNFPDCRRELIVDVGGDSDPSLIGEVCHIVAETPDGPRGESPLTREERDQYSNLILLCNVHHKIVDDHPREYTVAVLQSMKTAHEQWVRESLQGYDPARQRDEEVYASYVDGWVRRVNLDNWRGWSSNVMGSGQPHIAREQYGALREAQSWLFNRIWPKRYPELEDAFTNFLHILGDFLEVFHTHMEERNEMLFTRKFYRISEWDPERYDRLFQEFTFHVDLVMDLMLELTRAANYICDLVRQYLDPMFRLNEGAVIAQSGPYMNLEFIQHRAEYRNDERMPQLYKGLDHFLVERKNREGHFGEGTSIDDPEVRFSG